MGSKRLKSSDGKSQWGFWQWFDITDIHPPYDLYMRRLYVVKTPVGGLYVHWIFRPDHDRELHDHPWSFASLIVRGGYQEEIPKYSSDSDPFSRWSRLQSWNRWSVHRMKATDRHRIVSLNRTPTMTVCLVGRREREWGFWMADGLWMQWEEFIAMKQAERAEHGNA